MTVDVTSRAWRVRKVLRFIRIYGPGRTFIKVAGRLRFPLPRWPGTRSNRDVAMIGCGQFAFATIGYFLKSAFGARIAACFDIDERAAATFARAHDVPLACADAAQAIHAPGVRVVYVASNHASHTPYAVMALAAGHDVYVEKPVAVSLEQLATLERARRRAPGKLYAGYNRPFSKAMTTLVELMPIERSQGMSLQCFVSGHLLAPDHWYRRPEEGTRICGNVGHWLDLLIHLLARRGMPAVFDISLTWASPEEPDDNMVIALASDRGDVCSIMLTSRTEPFEGINESINLQHADTIARIDDFRRMTVWQGARLIDRRFWPKDVGHRRAILQPFDSEPARAWSEVVISSLLMLEITRMVRARIRESRFDLAASLAGLEATIGAS